MDIIIYLSHTVEREKLFESVQEALETKRAIRRNIPGRQPETARGDQQSSCFVF